MPRSVPCAILISPWRFSRRLSRTPRIQNLREESCLAYLAVRLKKLNRSQHLRECNHRLRLVLVAAIIKPHERSIGLRACECVTSIVLTLVAKTFCSLADLIAIAIGSVLAGKETIVASQIIKATHEVTTAAVSTALSERQVRKASRADQIVIDRSPDARDSTEQSRLNTQAQHNYLISLRTNLILANETNSLCCLLCSTKLAKKRQFVKVFTLNIKHYMYG